MKAITLKAARIVGPLTLDLDWSTGETLRADLAGWLRLSFDALREYYTIDVLTVETPA